MVKVGGQTHGVFSNMSPKVYCRCEAKNSCSCVVSCVLISARAKLTASTCFLLNQGHGGAFPSSLCSEDGPPVCPREPFIRLMCIVWTCRSPTQAEGEPAITISAFKEHEIIFCQINFRVDTWIYFAAEVINTITFNLENRIKDFFNGVFESNQTFCYVTFRHL